MNEPITVTTQVGYKKLSLSLAPHEAVDPEDVADIREWLTRCLDEIVCAFRLDEWNAADGR